MKNKILIIGHARHGKDTVAEMIQENTGLTFKSSSMVAAEIFIFDSLKEKYKYETFEECFEDRINHRAEWYNLICDYNVDDKSRLAKDIVATSDMYIGMRSRYEIDKCISDGVFNIIVGVFDPRKPLESSNSFDIDLFQSANIVICNNGSLDDLRNNVKLLTI